MNREILFRGKSIDSDEWVWGYHVFQRRRHYIYPFVEKVDDFSEIVQGYDERYFTPAQVDPDTVGQYTGYKQYGFADDIVSYFDSSNLNKHIGVIRFGEYNQDGSGGEYETSKCVGFYIERIKTRIDCWGDKWEPEYEKTISLFDAQDPKIVGNIYDNPELLEAAND